MNVFRLCILSWFFHFWGTGLLLAAPGEPPGPSIRVVTYNIMWEENGIRAGNQALPVWKDRLPLVVQRVRQLAPDVLALQEASPEQQAGLADALQDYALVYDLTANNTNPILYRTDRFKEIDSGVLILNQQPEIPETNIGVRSATWVHLEDRRNGKRFRIYSLHLDHRSKGPTRQISAVRLIEHAMTTMDPVIVAGDFNTRPESPTMTYFYGKTPLTNDAGLTTRTPLPLRNGFSAAPAAELRPKIDHILLGPGPELRTAGRLASGAASDHDLISVEWTWP